jgi:hypothetical protein
MMYDPIHFDAHTPPRILTRSILQTVLIDAGAEPLAIAAIQIAQVFTDNVFHIKLILNHFYLRSSGFGNL